MPVAAHKDFGDALVEAVKAEKAAAGSVPYPKLGEIGTKLFMSFKKKSPVKSKPTDEEWLQSIEQNPTYTGIDIRRELGKAQAWASEARKGTVSRRRFINWLNKAERPISYNGAGKTSMMRAVQANPGPAEWMAWCQDNIPGWRRFAEEAEGHPIPAWDQLEPAERKEILRQMQKP